MKNQKKEEGTNIKKEEKMQNKMQITKFLSIKCTMVIKKKKPYQIGHVQAFVEYVRCVRNVGQRLGVIVLVVPNRRLADVIPVHVHNVGRMLDDLLREVRVRSFVDHLPGVGAGIVDLRRTANLLTCFLY